MEKEKIERAAIELCTTEGQEGWVKDYGVSCFMAGAQWRINSVWHKPNEEPISHFDLMLYEYNDGEFELGYAFDPVRIRRWALVKDLFPERKEETKDVTVQDYKLYKSQGACYTGHETLDFCPHGKIEEIVAIEIKQNKEDMEEKEQCGDNRFEVIEKAKKHLLSSTNIESSKEEMKVLDNFLIRCWQMGWLDKYNDTKHSNSENIGKNLRKFDLEAAKSGKPVCTRDGRKARIICFDKKGAYPIVALVNDYNEEDYIKNYDEFGKKFIGGETSDDLMMLPEKKEGWVNVYKERCFESREEAISCRACDMECIDTIRVEWEE